MIRNFDVPHSDLVKLFSTIDIAGSEYMVKYVETIVNTVDDMPEEFGYGLLKDILDNTYDNINISEKLKDIEFEKLDIDKLNL